MGPSGRGMLVCHRPCGRYTGGKTTMSRCCRPLVRLVGLLLVVGSGALLPGPASAEVRPAPGISYVAGSTAGGPSASSVTVPAVTAAAAGDVLVAGRSRLASVELR